MGNLKYRLIFVHGFTSSSRKDWYPEISVLLDRRNVDYVVPNLPGGENPISSEWVNIIHKEIVKSKGPVVLVGHSLGTRAILLYLEKFPDRVEKVIFISPFTNRIGKAFSSSKEDFPDFFNHQIDVKRLKFNVGKFIVIHSTDDNSIEYLQGKELASDLKAKLITVNGHGHFSDSSNSEFIFNILNEELHF